LIILLIDQSSRFGEDIGFNGLTGEYLKNLFTVNWKNVVTAKILSFPELPKHGSIIPEKQGNKLELLSYSS
jgi:hypothetical protein